MYLGDIMINVGISIESLTSSSPSSLSISNKDVLFIFSANKVAAEELPQWVPLEQKVVNDDYKLNSSTYLHNPLRLSLVRLFSE